MTKHALSTQDVVDIQNLVYRYCWHLDHGDFTAMAQLFSKAKVTLPAGVFDCDPAGLEGIFRDYVQVYPDRTPRTRHVTTNLILDVEGPGEVSANSSVTVFQQTDKLPLQPVIGSRNFDRFIKTDDEWHFSSRRIEIDLLGNLSSHMKVPIQQVG